MSKAKIGIVHGQLGYGGSEASALWTLEVLKADYDLSLITAGRVDLPRLNQYYGTGLTWKDFTLRMAPTPLGLGNWDVFAALRGRYFQRYVQQVAPEFDVLISCYVPMDFGRPGIQRVSDFSFVEEWRLTLHPSLRSWKWWWWYRPSPLRRMYLAVCERISPSNPAAWKRNLTLSNSNWTAVLIREKYGIESQIVFPPVDGTFPEIPFSQRENGFVCLGRVSVEKRTDAVIEVISRVRQRGHAVHLHILGGSDNSSFGAKVRKLADQNREWVFLEGWSMGPKKKEILVGHRYGINLCENEAFGIAVAEMVQAGCIVFVPNGGGQVEIVDHPGLIFENEAEAVDKIDAVLANDAQQERLRAHLQRGSTRFSVETFTKEMRRAVTEFLERRTATNG